VNEKKSNNSQNILSRTTYRSVRQIGRYIIFIHRIHYYYHNDERVTVLISLRAHEVNGTTRLWALLYVYG
jgi:hypothetical protein